MAAVPGQPDAGQLIRELRQQLELNKPEKISPPPSIQNEPLQPDSSPVETSQEKAPPETKQAAPQEKPVIPEKPIPQVEPAPQSQPATEEPTRKAAPPAANEAEEVRVMVKAVHVSGITVFPASELESVVSYLIGGEHTLDELNEGVVRISNYYHDRGYVVARAYLPPQEIKNGEVVINVLEGYIGRKIVDNQSRLSDQRARDFLREVKSGDVLAAAPVDRQLFILNEVPGVGTARAILQPGASVGTADIVFDLTPAVPYLANIEADNYGNYYTGQYRLGAELVLNSPLNIGDQVILRSMTSNQRLFYSYLAYQLPLGSSGLRFGGAYFDTRYQLAEELAVLQAHGTASSSSLFTIYPFVRSPVSSVTGTFILESKKLVDVLDLTSTITDKSVKLANLGLSGRYQDAQGSASMATFDVSLVKGSLSMDDLSLAFDFADTHGQFTRFTYHVNRVKKLNDTELLSLSLSGQRSSKNLNSSEQFTLGGVNAVRAYPQGEASGDEGWVANFELRHSIAPTVLGTLFYDIGAVNFNRFPYLSGDNHRQIAGVGMGVNANIGDGQIKSYVAFRTSNSLPTSEPATLNRNPRIWLQASWLF